MFSVSIAGLGGSTVNKAAFMALLGTTVLKQNVELYPNAPVSVPCPFYAPAEGGDQYTQTQLEATAQCTAELPGRTILAFSGCLHLAL